MRTLYNKHPIELLHNSRLYPRHEWRGFTRYLINDCHVRRLTPTECERLQGFPDGYTDVPFGKRMSSDAQRYFALGNSMAVPVVRWIGERIEAVKGFLGETQNDD